MFWFAVSLMLLAEVAQENAAPPTPSTTVILVVGEPGEEKYEALFTQWLGRWQQAMKQSDFHVVTIGPPSNSSEEQPDRELLVAALQEAAEQPPEKLWLVLIGHGTFDGKKAKFNLRGTDISAAELAAQLQPIACPTAVINCASASAPFIDRLSATDRVIVTSTQSGFEYNFARFGNYLSQAIGDGASDLDKDGQTSLLEAWLSASKQTQASYAADGQLATEHALLDDNGDGKGTPSDWFRGIHLIKTPKDGAVADGTLANQFVLVPGPTAIALSPEQLEQRNMWEQQLYQLRQQKNQLSEEEYLSRLQAILVPLAKLYESADPTEEEPEGQDTDASSSPDSPSKKGSGKEPKKEPAAEKQLTRDKLEVDEQKVDLAAP